MYEQYPKFFVDCKAARSQLAQMFASAGDWKTKHRFAPASGRTLATPQHKTTGIHKAFPRYLVRSITHFVYRIRVRTLLKQPGAETRDIFGFVLVLVLLPA
jgi:hypothetical protein